MSNRAAQSAVRRAGWIYVAMGAIFFLGGLTLQAWQLKWITVGRPWLYWDSWMASIVLVGGLLWLLLRGLEEGLHKDFETSLAIVPPLIAAPILVSVYFDYWPHRRGWGGAEDALAGVVLMVGGLIALKYKLPEPGETPKPWM